MKLLLLVTGLLTFGSLNAQHCPWDCTGFLMLRTDASYKEMKQLQPVLVDGKKQVIIDTLYGTGKSTNDLCEFLYFDDFKNYRAKKTELHHWYAYDTLLDFSAGHYVVHYNYCRYRRNGTNDLYIRFIDPHDNDAYHYIEIPASQRIHLHDFSSQIMDRNFTAILDTIEPAIIKIDRKTWRLDK
jgi:hypothetical protein